MNVKRPSGVCSFFPCLVWSESFSVRGDQASHAYTVGLAILSRLPQILDLSQIRLGVIEGASKVHLLERG